MKIYQNAMKLWNSFMHFIYLYIMVWNATKLYLFHCYRRLSDVLKRKRTPKRAVTSNRKTRQDSDNNLSSSVMQDLFSKGILLCLKKLGSLELPGKMSLKRACCKHQTVAWLVTRTKLQPQNTLTLLVS